MSENQSFPASSDASEQSISSQTENWETLPIPGTVNTIQGSVEPHCESISENISPEREGELLSLIHDLNQCNDVLLSRVKQLESALESSKSSHRSAQEASSHNAQQQVAKLVGELDNAEQALSRQILVSENLQTEVDNQHERISQLERECTIVAQQHLEEVQARAKAEATSKDLRSRLQRQQRYTMQFKAALEKSLTVTAKPSNTTSIQPVSYQDSAAVAMPRAQRIMPWVSDKSSPFAGIDPHLESLIRGVGKSDAQASESRIVPQDATETIDSAAAETHKIAKTHNTDNKAAESAVEGDGSPDAKAKLWQDIERVMSHTDVKADVDNEQKAVGVVTNDAEETVSKPAETDESEQPNDTLPAQSQTQPQASGLETAQADSETEKAKPVSEDNSLEKDDLIHQIERSFAATSRQTPEEPVAFTEPSPWGVPLSEKQTDKKLEKIAAGVETRQASRQKDSYLPAVDSKVDSSVSPLVKPLQVSSKKAAPTQRKSGSLPDIELPTFQNAKVASFRR